MCINCTYDKLEQLRWELLVQHSELKGEKPSPEIVDTVKDRMKNNKGLLLPRVRLKRSDGMNDQQYDEAKSLFKQAMMLMREKEIEAISIVSDLLEREVMQKKPVVHIDAMHILNGSDELPDYPVSDSDS